MEYIKKFLLRGLAGMTLGVFINQFIFTMYSLGKETIVIQSSAVIFQFIISSLVGFYCAGITVIFEVEKWSRLRQTITHAIAMLVYFPLAIYAGWMPSNVIGIVMFILFYVLVYFITWISFKRYWEKEAKQLNDVLKKR
ncbi:MAG: DUF3021 domain-containing protein [Clostridium sp.]|uniref:DUF3021 domain-containing protein n=1 Tax=Clostridium sp. TaxID=1506 RepID=UPI003F3D78B3